MFKYIKLITPCRPNKSLFKKSLFIMLLATSTSVFNAFSAGNDANGATKTIVKPNKNLPELPSDTLGKVEKLPYPYPDSWVIVYDASFLHTLDGHYIVVDINEKTVNKQYKGAIPASFMTSFAQSAKRQEFYVLETFYSRGVRGVRTDVVSIYDPKTLAVKSEVVFPVAKRANSMPEKYAAQLIGDDKYLLIFNLTPATSVYVLDLDSHKFVSEISIAGCALIYPTGKLGFSSLCSNGGMYSVQLDSKGQLKSDNHLPAFFDTTIMPIFEKPLYYKGIAYFPTFDGEIQPIDMTSDTPKLLKKWSLVTADEKKHNWRPGGWQFNAISDKNGKNKAYFIMNPNGKTGSHKDGGSEIWVFDLLTKKKLQTIKLKNWGISVAITDEKTPRLVITNSDMKLDVYVADTGKYQQTISDIYLETPFVVYPVEK